MNKFSILLKINLINSLGLNNVKHGKKNGAKSTFVGAAFVIGIFLVAAMVVFYSSSMAFILKQFGMLDLLLAGSMIAGSLLVFFTSVYKAQGILFGGRDFEILGSLPVKTSVIISSKLIELLIFNYLFLALIIIPTSIIYFINSNVGPVFFLFMIAAFIFIPIIPIVAASILAFILSFAASKTKHKNAILTLLSIALVIVILAFSFKANDIINYAAANSTSIGEMLNKIYPPAYYYSNALSNLSIVSLIKLIIWSLIPFIIFTVVFAKGYKNINSKIREKYKKSDYRIIKLETSSMVIALFKKELKRYFSSPVYVMNTSLGLILAAIAAIVCIFDGKEELINSLAASNGFDIAVIEQYINEFFQFVPIIILLFCVGLSCTTGASISIEGKNFWILKSLPVRTIDILKSKIGVNLALSIPTIILCTILFWIGFDLTPINVLLTFLIPALLAVFVAVSGVIINLYFPKLDWSNEVQVVKQSLSSMISIFLGVVLVAIIMGLCYISIRFLKITNIYIYLAGMTVLFLTLDIISIVILKKKAVKLFERLSC